MKAQLLRAIASIESAPLALAELPTPTPGPDELLLRVRCCAICRTDLHVIEGDLPTARLPLIPGHQVVGVVEACGPGCQRFKPGDRAGVAWLRGTCGECIYCRSGQENLCESARFTGYHADGGYAEFATVREDFAYALPAAFSDADAAPLLCAGIIGYRALRRACLPRGGTVVLYGFGSSAHVVLQLVKHRQGKVFVVTRGERHRELARAMGADWVSERAADLPAPADSAIIFAPAGELVPEALRGLRRGGTLALAGIHMTPIPPLDYDTTLFYERDLRSVTCNTRDDGRDLLAEAAEIPIRPHVQVYPFAEANRALLDLKQDRINGTGVLVVAE